MRIVMDIESDGFLDVATIIHCMSYLDIDTGKMHSTTSYHEMRRVLDKKDLTIIGHNIILFDIRLLEKLLSIKIEATLIDTLLLSWYLYPSRAKHGLEKWGEELGVKKPEIKDWIGITNEEDEIIRYYEGLRR